MNGAIVGAATLVGLYWTLVTAVSFWYIAVSPEGTPVRLKWDATISLTFMLAITGAFWGWVIGWLVS